MQQQLQQQQQEHDDFQAQAHQEQQQQQAQQQRLEAPREHKIRIVERLSTFRSALHAEGEGGGGSGWTSEEGTAATITALATGSSVTTGPLTDEDAATTTLDAVEWLDEKELGSLSQEQLEHMMDLSLTTVVRELVNIATLDEELVTELDSLDMSGFSLLHYCCLYNLNTLVPVLLAKGASVNHRTACGTTALHLAAGAGHLAVTELVIQGRADLFAVDAYGLLPSDRARMGGYTQVLQCLTHYTNAYLTAGRAIPTTTNSPMAAVEGSGAALLPSGHSTLATNANTMDVSSVPSSSFFGVSSHALYNSLDRASTSFDTEDLEKHQQQQQIHSCSSSSISVGGSGSGGGGGGVGSMSQKQMLLHDAFSSLSLADKCALSLSLSATTEQQHQQQQQQQQVHHQPQNYTMSADVSFKSSSPKSNHSFGNISDCGGDGDGGGGGGRGIDGGDYGEGGEPINGYWSNDDLDMDMQSMLSESDKESLDVAMSMMGQKELLQLEDEARRIQNNVRGWLLRKNYVNLREAARTLQQAWRDRRKDTSSRSKKRSLTGATSPSSSSSTFSSSSSSSSSSSAASHSSSSFVSTFEDIQGVEAMDTSSEDVVNQQQIAAASTLQAATRGMLARRSFFQIRRQTMATLVIQRTVMAKLLRHQQHQQQLPLVHQTATLQRDHSKSSSMVLE